jgi:hypothetical protein
MNPLKSLVRLGMLLFVLVVLITLPTPAKAVSSDRFELLGSGPQTATAQGAAIPVRNVRTMIVFVECTAHSGSATPTIDLYLQSSSDGGSTWYDLTAITRQETTNPPAATEVAATQRKRNLLEGETDCTTNDVRVAGMYEIFGDSVRAAWVISGTTPSFTVEVSAIAKN